MDTLLLDVARWDATVDADGNIAVASESYSTAQDVASACRTFIGDCYYDQTIGLPYFQSILGELPPVSLLKAQYEQAAMTVPGVTNPQCFLNAITDRNLTGQIQFTDSNGEAQVVGLGGKTTIFTEFAITDQGSPGVTDGGQEMAVG